MAWKEHDCLFLVFLFLTTLSIWGNVWICIVLGLVFGCALLCPVLTLVFPGTPSLPNNLFPFHSLNNSSTLRPKSVHGCDSYLMASPTNYRECANPRLRGLESQLCASSLESPSYWFYAARCKNLVMRLPDRKRSPQTRYSKCQTRAGKMCQKTKGACCG